MVSSISSHILSVTDSSRVLSVTSRKSAQRPVVLGKPLLLIGLSAFLSVKREVKEQLAQSITQQERQTIVAKDAHVLKVREDLTDELTLSTVLRSIRIIDNQAYRLVVRCIRATADLPQQLEVHRIEQLAPLDITIIHKTIEHVLLTTEQAA